MSSRSHNKLFSGSFIRIKDSKKIDRNIGMNIYLINSTNSSQGMRSFTMFQKLLICIIFHSYQYKGFKHKIGNIQLPVLFCVNAIKNNLRPRILIARVVLKFISQTNSSAVAVHTNFYSMKNLMVFYKSLFDEF